MAEASFLFTVAREPSFVPALVRLGQIQASTGRPEEAVSVWRQALVLDPSLDKVRSEMERLMNREKGAP